ncbi:MAG: hypothetical protein IMZ44_23690 [Planctomycetes bacterium]|nr:hypothetical protein [Planctomycetota bacterium]
MSVTCTEKFDSRPAALGDNPAIELLYVIKGADDEAAALTALKGTAPSTYTVDSKNLVRQTCKVDPVGDGSDYWDGSAQYGRMSSAKKEVGQSSFSFDTGGGTMHVTQAKAHVASYALPGKTPPDYGGAVGVTHDSVEGCDITVPVYNFSETHFFAAGYVTGSYKATLFALTGRTNNAAFKGFAEGEVLFLGASGSQRGDDSWEITFRFAASPNVTGLTIGSITGIDKKGWEYLWVQYEDAEDSGAKCVVKRPASVHVERVYDSGSLAGLGIGT